MRERNEHEHSIRFITTDYEELFRIPDGGTVLVTFPDRQFAEKCSYIDDYHMKVGNSVYHICQYAEILKQNGGRCAPEPETELEKAAWQLGHREYLMLERTDAGFRYEILTKEFLSRTQGQLDRPEWTMNQAREYVLDLAALDYRSRFAVSYDMVKQKSREEGRNAKMSKWDESHTEILHDIPAEKDVLIRAMEAARYTLDTIESTDDLLRFFGEGGQTMIMAGWHECEAWLNGVVFDDPAMSDRVEMILHPERFVTAAAATSTTMRAIEDMVEQNDNQFDGIINNLPDEPPAGSPDPAKAAREAGDAAERRSVLEKLREEERARPARPPRPFLPDREERSLE